MSASDHAAKMLAATTKLRSTLEKKVGPLFRGAHWVMDTCCGVHDPESKTPLAKLVELKQICGPDGVHLTSAGYSNLVGNFGATIIRLQNGLIGKFHPTPDTASTLVSGPSTSGTFFWRGFSSPVGSRRPNHNPPWAKATRDWSYRARGPYDNRPHGPKLK